MKRILLVAAMVSVSAASSVHAADLAYVQPEQFIAPQSVYDWSGFYAGVNLGYGWGEVEFAPVGLPGGGTDDVTGALGGAQVGYNHNLGGFVLGAEADLQFSGLTHTNAALGLTESLQYFGTVRARAGLAVDRFMPYVTAGVAFGRGRLEVPAAGVDETADHFGWTAGAGVEYAVTDAITLKAEYLYTDLGTQTYSAAGGDIDADVRFSTVRAGVNFQF